MECQSSDSKKLFKVFDASKRKRTRKKREGLDDSNSIATDDSTSGCQATVMRVSSAKASLQDIPTAQTVAVTGDNVDPKRDRDSSPSVSRSPGRGDTRHSCRSPRRHRRSTRDGVSLALKAGLVSTPRSTSPHQEADGAIDSIPQDQDSFIYAFLEEAIKRDKKRQRERHSRRHEDRRMSHEHEREVSGHREHRHRHRRRHDHDASRERDRPKKEEAVAPAVDQAVLFETFAKICSQLNAKSTAYANPVPRTLSHKSLQCEVVSRRDSYDVDHHPVRLRSHEHSRENVCKTRSQDNCRGRVYSHERIPANPRPDKDKCNCCYDKDVAKYSSKLNMTRSKMRNVDDDRYPDYPPENPRNHLDHGYRSRAPDNRDYRDYDREFAKEKHYENDKRRYYDQKTSRSFEVSRDGYPDDEKYCRRTARSDNNKEKHYDERDKYYEEKHMDPRDRYLPSKDRRVKRNLDRFERTSVASRDDDYRDRDRDRYSERERDSGLSVADGENSTVSGKSNYLRVVKQEIAEQREAMDKMMKLWKELMRCFKGMSTQGQTKSVHVSEDIF
ncbi:uncharacterized protein DDB_G0283697-like [Ostrinia nubilalis]|uniref:uncharacterized protein DDB_G0283697-like n=1 Tax=Ostrinia nubilalis TaxID=29057 RepID=UPI0030826257